MVPACPRRRFAAGGKGLALARAAYRGPIGATDARTSGNGASRVSSRRDPANKHVAYACEASYHCGAWQRVVVWVPSSRASRQHGE